MTNDFLTESWKLSSSILLNLEKNSAHFIWYRAPYKNNYSILAKATWRITLSILLKICFAQCINRFRKKLATMCVAWLLNHSLSKRECSCVCSVTAKSSSSLLYEFSCPCCVLYRKVLLECLKFNLQTSFQMVFSLCTVAINSF